METLYKFDSHEIEHTLHLDYIAATFVNREAWDNQYLTAKIRLQQAGWTEEKYNELVPLIQKAKYIVFHSQRCYALFSSDDCIKLRNLLDVASIINNNPQY